MDWRDALTSTQQAGIKEAAEDITWKRGQVRDRQWRWSTVTDMQVELALAADIACLEQHPTKKSLLATAQTKSRKSGKPEDCNEDAKFAALYQLAAPVATVDR